MMRLGGKVAVVTGTARDTLSDVAWTLKEAGAVMVLMAPDASAGRRLTLALNAGNRGVALFIPGDPRNPADLAEAQAEARRAWGGCDLVVTPGPADVN